MARGTTALRLWPGLDATGAQLQAASGCIPLVGGRTVLSGCAGAGIFVILLGKAFAAVDKSVPLTRACLQSGGGLSPEILYTRYEEK